MLEPCQSGPMQQPPSDMLPIVSSGPWNLALKTLRLSALSYTIMSVKEKESLVFAEIVSSQYMAMQTPSAHGQEWFF